MPLQLARSMRTMIYCFFLSPFLPPFLASPFFVSSFLLLFILVGYT